MHAGSTCLQYSKLVLPSFNTICEGKQLWRQPSTACMPYECSCTQVTNRSVHKQASNMQASYAFANNPHHRHQGFTSQRPSSEEPFSIDQLCTACDVVLSRDQVRWRAKRIASRSKLFPEEPILCLGILDLFPEEPILCLGAQVVPRGTDSVPRASNSVPRVETMLTISRRVIKAHFPSPKATATTTMPQYCSSKAAAGMQQGSNKAAAALQQDSSNTAVSSNAVAIQQYVRAMQQAAAR